MGPREPTLRERLAWAGISSQGELHRERSLRWRRRQKQLRKEAGRDKKEGN